ncbi:hypothetical protein KEM52_002024 [Ascosphaera acerosa]|nr:hypothetical protein KEM52_002024 [Ascosphaera acerosa]
MSLAHTSAYASPLKGYENAPSLPEWEGSEKNGDGKSYKNNQTGILSDAYGQFPAPNNAAQKKFAHELWQRIRHEFPELNIYKFWEEPIGPHPTAMFEACVTTPQQFGAFIPWLVVNRGPLSVLVHPNTTKEDELYDHTVRGFWLGQPVKLDTDCLQVASNRQMWSN